MKDKFKKIFNVVFGSDKDIPFKIATSLFITSLILSIFTWIYRENSLRLTFFTYVSSISFSFWLIFSYGIDTSAKIAYEAFRLIIFFPIFIISIYYLLPNSSNNIFIIILSCFGIFFSCIYFIDYYTAFRFINFHFIIYVRRKITKRFINLFNTTIIKADKNQVIFNFNNLCQWNRHLFFIIYTLLKYMYTIW